METPNSICFPGSSIVLTTHCCFQNDSLARIFSDQDDHALKSMLTSDMTWSALEDSFIWFWAS
jgi:hypothetical protein